MGDVFRALRECKPWFVDEFVKPADWAGGRVVVTLPFTFIEMDRGVAEKWRQKWLEGLSDCSSPLAVFKLSCLLEKHGVRMVPAYVKDAECNGLTLFIPAELASRFIPLRLTPTPRELGDVDLGYPTVEGGEHPLLTTLLAAAFAMTVCTSGEVKTGNRFYECIYRHGFEGFRECLDVARDEGLSILRELWSRMAGLHAAPPPNNLNTAYVLANGFVLLRTGFQPFDEGGAFTATYSAINHLIGGLPYLASEAGGEAKLSNVIRVSAEDAERLRGFGDSGCGIYSLSVIPVAEQGRKRVYVALTLPVHASVALAAAMYRLLERGGLDARDPELEKALPWLIALASSHDYHLTCDELAKLLTGRADEIREIAEKRVSARFAELAKRYSEHVRAQREWEDIEEYI